MNNDKKEILENNAKEYFYSEKDNLLKKRYNSAVVLFFKSLISFVDIYILINTGKVPSSHGHRFRILHEEFSEVYDIVDKDFPFYQNSYVQSINKETVEVVKDDAKFMAEKTKIKL